MTASIANDKLRGVKNGGSPQPTTVAGARTIGGTSLSCVVLTNWFTNTPVDFVTFKKKSDGSVDQSTKAGWKGIVSGNTITSLTLVFGTDSGNVVGDFVECAPTDEWAQGIYDWGTVSHNTDGTLKTGIVTPTAIAANAITTPAIADNSVTADKVNFATFTRPTVGMFNPNALGNVSVTGLGFKPNKVRFDILSDRGLAPSTTDTVTGIGYADGTQQFTSVQHTTGSNSYMYNSSSNCLSGIHFNSTVPEFLASFVSFDNDGFTVNVSAKISGYYFMYTAY